MRCFHIFPGIKQSAISTSSRGLCSYEVRSITTVGAAVAVTVRITIPAMEDLIFREATGYEPLGVKGYSNPTSNAESMSIRGAAAKFGLCLSLYDK
jgi:hypothetical protein